MIVTDAGQVLTNMTLFATLASDVSNQIGMAAYIYLMTDRPGAFETLESAADGRLVLCEASTLGDELKKSRNTSPQRWKSRPRCPKASTVSASKH